MLESIYSIVFLFIFYALNRRCKIGLGSSFFSEKSALLEQMLFDALQEAIQTKSNFYRYSLLSNDK